MDVIRKALAVAGKDLRVIFADRGFMIPLFLVPLLVGLFSAAVFGGGDSTIHLPVIVVNQDVGPYGQSITKVLQSIAEIELSEQETAVTAEGRVATGESMAALIIPPNFSQNLDSYQPSEITVLLDPAQAGYGRIITSIVEEICGALAIQGEIRYGIREVLADTGFDPTSNPELARAAQAQVEGVLFTQIQRMETDAPIQVLWETLTGPDVLVWNNTITLVLPGFAVLFAFFIVPELATQLLQEREAGSLRRLVAAPLPRSALIGGKVLAYLLVVIIQMVTLLGIGAVFLDMSLGQSPLGLFLLILGLGLSTTTLGMLLAALARSIDQAGSIGMLLVFVLGALGGGFDPINALFRGDGFMAILSRLTPQAQAVMGLQSLLIQKGGLVDILPNFAYLIGLSLVFFLIAIWCFRFES